MPIVLVRGNPETSAIWDEMRQHLDRTDVIALSPPGSGAAVPDGFTATSNSYADWLALEVQKLDGPVDLVGHDWSGGAKLGHWWMCQDPKRAAAMQGLVASCPGR